jgi:energy-converting hydrogenase Eha subunit F
MQARLLAVVIAMTLIPMVYGPAIAGGVSSSGQAGADLHGAGLLSPQQIEQQYNAEIRQIWIDTRIVIGANVVKASIVAGAVIVAAPAAVASAILYVVTTGTDLVLTKADIVPEKPFRIRVSAPFVPGFTIGWDIGGILNKIGSE